LPEEGYTRHQFVLAVDYPSWAAMSESERNKLIFDNFGLFAAMFTEQVMEDDKWVAFHYWMDVPDENKQDKL